MKRILQFLLKYSGFIGLLLMICGGIWRYFSFKDYQVLSIGTITKVERWDTFRQGSDYTVYYEFQLSNGQYFKSSSGRSLCVNLTYERVKELLTGKKFPLIYENKNPSNNYIMMTIKGTTMLNRETFPNYKYPDSLLVYDSILTCK